MSKAIIDLYKKVGLTPPKGKKGIHSASFHSCVVAVTKKIQQGKMPKGSNAHAICMESIGRAGAVKKSHWSKTYKDRIKEKAK